MNKKANVYIKKVCGILMMMALTVSMLSGCQLAEEEAVVKQAENEDITNQDIFCGAFISAEDLFYEEDLDLSAEEIMKLVEGEEVDPYEEKVEGDRIYATKKIEETEDGYEHEEFVFEGCEGIAAYRYYEIKEGLQPCSTIGAGSDDGAADLSYHYKTVDGGQEDEITGTIYVNEIAAKKYLLEDIETEQYELFVYPVYQTRKGEIYLIADGSIGVYDGTGYSLSEKTKSDIAGEVEEYSCTVDLKFEVSKPVDKTIVYQMNANNEVIETVELDNAKLPEKLKVEKEVEYVIVEEYNDNKLVDRDMVNMSSKYDDEFYGCFETTEKTDGELFLEVAEVDLKRKK